MTTESEYDQLLRLSEKVGSDPALVQAAGGNTSIIIDDTLWIKASGTWLMNARRADIMVPVTLPLLLDALAKDDPAAERAQAFVDQQRNPGGLRPSIETTVHAVLPQMVVVHVHCVQTIAVAVRTDAEAELAKRLQGFNWAYVPYVRPGLPLCRAIASAINDDTDVVILGNHGLVVAADTVAEAEDLLQRVCASISETSGAATSEAAMSKTASSVAPRQSTPFDQQQLLQRADNSEYRLPALERSHLSALDPVSLNYAGGGSLYPDHVIFLGDGAAVAREGETATEVCARLQQPDKPVPMLILFPGLGALIHQSADDAKEAMAQCLADVTVLIEPQAQLHYLNEEQTYELLNWDAEQYRQSLNRQS